MATSSLRRRLRLPESNENADSGNPTNPLSVPQRSPLLSIQEPGAGTPRSGPNTPRKPLVGHCGRARDRTVSSSRFPRNNAGESRCLVPSEVSSFELDGDLEFWKDRNVQVLIRIRPLNGAEISSNGYARCLVQESAQTLLWTGHPETRFTFDHVACETISQEKLFEVVGVPMVENCMSGYNSCMFAYGQTGSGKTHTMMGELKNIGNMLNEDRGITPRIFEYLFTRIKEEEHNRSDEQLRYSCKCSFLEIYNEQITDLLEPSSSNLQLREDIDKGVYVENLREHDVSSVNDVVELLLQGATNRKIAATAMNTESSRSHSVFTCVIESRWDRESMSHLRSARLNLVDLAGSERQKSSGAEGERLKEAVNINRSLSTLGLVIMSLVDIANGKNRHVPYRDSRLTFLLQDSLGGNSKTTIVANVSPSICSANETLSTLKFAQRAKLIQNNAKVNEDASGDVLALHQQIQKLKDQLSLLIKHQSVPNSPCYSFCNLEQKCSGIHDINLNTSRNGNPNALDEPLPLNKKIQHLEDALIGSLKREKSAEAEIKRLGAEMEHMNCLLYQSEDEIQRTNAMLKIQNEKLKRLELLTDSTISSDEYLMEENSALREENQLLRESIDMNPDLTHFALENMRLIEQLRIYQSFNQGERDFLLIEISHLRNQLLESLKRKDKEDDDSLMELNSCREQMDVCLENKNTIRRECKKMYHQLNENLDLEEFLIDTGGSSTNVDHKIHKTYSQSYETTINQVGFPVTSAYNHHPIMVSYNIPRDNKDKELQLSDPTLLIKTVSAIPQEVRMTSGVHSRKQESDEYLEHVNREFKNETHITEPSNCGASILEWSKEAHVQLSEDRVSESRDTATSALCAKPTHEDEMAKQQRAAVTQLLKEPTEFKQKSDDINSSSSLEDFLIMKTYCAELSKQVCFLTQENSRLSELVSANEVKTIAISDEWEKAIIDLTHFLTDGSQSLEDACEHIEELLDSFPQGHILINEHVERAINVVIEKEMLIVDLQKRLEGAQKMGLEMKSKLNCLRGATLAVTEVQQLENQENAQEISLLRKLLSEKELKIQELENALRLIDNRVERKVPINSLDKISVEANAEEAWIDSPAIFEVPNSCTEQSEDNNNMQTLGQNFIPLAKYAALKKHEPNDEETTSLLEQRINEINRTLRNSVESAKALCVSNTDIEEFIAALGSEAASTFSSVMELPVVKVESVAGYSDEKIENAEVICEATNGTRQVKSKHAIQEVEEKTNHVDLLSKLTEVQEALEEAENVLSALLKMNEDIKHERDCWREKSLEVLAENTLLAEELDKLQISSSSAQRQYQRFHEQVDETLTDIVNLVSSKKDFFQDIQRTMTDDYTTFISDLFSFRHDFQNCISSLRSLLDEMASESLENSFEFLVLFQCKIEAFLTHARQLNLGYEALQSRQISPCLVSSNIGQTLVPKDQLSKPELARKDEIMEGLLFDLRLLQESASKMQDEKDEMKKVVSSLNKVQNELTGRTSQLNEAFKQNKVLEAKLTTSEDLLFLTRSELEEQKKICAVLSEENSELRLLLDEEHSKNTHMKGVLEEKEKITMALESEILSLASGEMDTSIARVFEDIKTVTSERDNLQTEVIYLKDKLDMALALADEKEAIAVEAHQVAESSKIYAEEKEQEVEILEHTIEELERTVDVMEKKVSEMKEEIENHRLAKDHLELVVQALKLRISITENVVENLFKEDSSHIRGNFLETSNFDLHEAKRRIKELEMESIAKNEEIEQHKKYTSEVVLHSEAQSFLLQEKFKELESTISILQAGPSKSCSTMEQIERVSVRTRGSGSPFRCISTLVQQINSEQNKEISLARQRIDELEALLLERQKEVCMLNARLAAVDCMTHDVIKDLLGVKLDMTSYAKLIDQDELQKLLQKAHESSEETKAKDFAISDLKKQINRLREDKQSLIEDNDKKREDMLTVQMMMEQLRQRHQLLIAQNEILKKDKSSLRRTIARMDKGVRLQVQSECKEDRSFKTSKLNTSDHGSSSQYISRFGELSRKLDKEDKHLSRYRNEFARCKKYMNNTTDRNQ